MGHVKIFMSSDIGSITAGEEWLTSLQRAIRRASAMLVLCSTRSVSRPWVQFELGAAWFKQTRIIPLCHSGMTPDELTMPLAPLHAAQLGTETGIRILYDAVAAELDWPKVPEPRDLAGLLSRIHELEIDFENELQQFERYIDVVIPAPGVVDCDRIPDNTKIESDAESLKIFGLIASTRWTWLDICKAAQKTKDTRWLKQLQRCIQKASQRVRFYPVQAIYHTEEGSYQPQLAKREVQLDGSCRYHVHFVETTVAPLTDVDNDLGLLATLLRLGLRFRYEVIEHVQRMVKALQLQPITEHAGELERTVSMLRGAIERIELDTLSRGAQNFHPYAVVALFEREEEQREIVSLQSTWRGARDLLFRETPPLTASELQRSMNALGDMNHRFMCMATSRYHEMVSKRWGVPSSDGEKQLWHTPTAPSVASMAASPERPAVR
jgi:hypothetical protein